MHYFNEMDLYVNSHSLSQYQWLISGRVKISPVIVKSSERIGEHLSTWRRIEDITAQELTARVGAGADTIVSVGLNQPSGVGPNQPDGVR